MSIAMLQMKPAKLSVTLMAGLYLCCVVVAQDGAANAPRVASPDEVKLLIAKLGDRAFAVREAATTRLAEMDVSIRPALTEAIKSRDAEVRMRARRILVIVNQRYFETRLVAFVSDADGKQGVELPGWSRFQSLAGKGREARELFVEMQRAEPRILEATESKLENINELLADRLQEGFQTPQFGGSGGELSAASAAALVFVASDPKVQLRPESASLVGMLIYQPPFHAALAGPRGEGVKTLLAAWVMRETDDTALLMQNVYLAKQHNLSVGRDLAKTVLGKGDLPPHAVAQAMSLLALSGKKEDAALLESFLGDETVIANFNRNDPGRHSLKVCDFAMAMMIVLTGNKPDQFRDGPLRWNQGWNVDEQTLAFPTDEDRQAALKKWKAWWTENKGKLGKEDAEKKAD
jgi:hypothetical protein